MAADGIRYKVTYLEPVRAYLKECCKKAVAKGLGAKLLEVLIALDERLHEDPWSFGDPWNRVGNLELLHRLYPPLDVVYAVHRLEAVVFVRDIHPYPADFFD